MGCRPQTAATLMASEGLQPVKNDILHPEYHSGNLELLTLTQNE